MLALGEFEDLTEDEAKKKIAKEYSGKGFRRDPFFTQKEILKELSSAKILIAYQSGWDGYFYSSWILFWKEFSLFEVYGARNSCHGFEGQWTPEKTSLQYLCSKSFLYPTLDDKEKELNVRRAIWRFLHMNENFPETFPEK